jgi:hypothetical protein
MGKPSGKGVAPETPRNPSATLATRRSHGKSVEQHGRMAGLNAMDGVRMMYRATVSQCLMARGEIRHVGVAAVVLCIQPAVLSVGWRQ